MEGFETMHSSINAIWFILYLLFLDTSVLGQNVTGQVIDTNTKEPIPYVNIGIIGKNIGTVSDAYGNFKLSVTDALASDSLRFSMVSYEAKTFAITDVRRFGIPKSIALNERHIELREVIVSGEMASQITLGLARKHCYPIPLYKGASSNLAFPQAGYRHEIGTRFPNNELIYLDSIQINLAASNVDTLPLRLNIYEIKNETINNILAEPIYISLTKKEAESYPIIDLTKYQIEVKSDFLVTIENYKHLPGGSIKILANFKAKGRKYPTYYRSSSQSNWIRFLTKKSKDIGLSIVVFGQ